MDYLVSMQEAIDALEKEKPTPFVNKDGSIDPFGAGRQNQWYRDGIAIMNLPSAQPERKTGKWINHRNDDGHNIADCNQCGNAIQWFDGDEIPRYCCMCGARMRGDEDE